MIPSHRAFKSNISSFLHKNDNISHCLAKQFIVSPHVSPHVFRDEESIGTILKTLGQSGNSDLATLVSKKKEFYDKNTFFGYDESRILCYHLYLENILMCPNNSLKMETQDH